MGNLISNSSRANNPTYKVVIAEDGRAVIEVKHDAYYDFEEYEYNTLEEAESKIPEYLKRHHKWLKEKLAQLKNEVFHLELKIMSFETARICAGGVWRRYWR